MPVSRKESGSKRKSKRSVRKRHTSRLARVSQTADHRAARQDTDVQRFLFALAQLLVPAGITPKHFSELAKHAFVHAASDISRFRNGKINHSRVAVLTGLSRVEVKRLLIHGKSGGPRRITQQSRAERVVRGWMVDRRFLELNGLPRDLPVRGGATSFASLARKYAGDVPYRAVLNELLRMRVVKQTDGHLALKRYHSSVINNAVASLTALLPMLSDGVRAATSKRPPLLYRLNLDARTLLDLFMLRDRAAEGMSALLEGLKVSLPYKPTRSRTLGAPKKTLTISSIISFNDKS